MGADPATTGRPGTTGPVVPGEQDGRCGSDLVGAVLPRPWRFLALMCGLSQKITQFIYGLPRRVIRRVKGGAAGRCNRRNAGWIEPRGRPHGADNRMAWPQ